MKLKRLALTVVIGAAVLTLAVMYQINFGGRVVIADSRTNVFDTEYAAGYEGALNRTPIPPIASIANGERVAVLWDTYGKDYWACYVRTSKGVRGWALCTCLRMVG